MPGMTAASAVAYAAPANEEKTSAKHIVTVAEFRNGFNPITKYYDKWDINDFLQSGSIPLRTKIEVMLGKYVASFVDDKKLDEIASEMKGE